MFISPKPYKSNNLTSQSNSSFSKVWKKSFQLTGLLFLLSFVFLIPVIESTLTNFSHFIALSREIQPELSTNFQREQYTSIILFSLSLVSAAIVLLFYSKRFFSQQENTLKKISEHISQLQNENLNIAYISTHPMTDEVKEIVQNLDYLQMNLIESLQTDIQVLESLRRDFNDHTSRTLVDKLIENKRKQLGNPSQLGEIIPLRKTNIGKKSA